MSEILRARDRTRTPWRNGAGFATDVVAEPRNASVGDFDWRISIATVDEDADFSSYPGIDRLLMPLSPGGLDLEIDGTVRHTAQFEVQAFAGESLVRSVNVASTSLDLNLMLRRGRVAGTLTIHRVEGELVVEAGAVALVIAGSVAGLELYDAVVGPSTAAGSGLVAIADIRVL
jgi:environmental stress-induced protein Ves